MLVLSRKLHESIRIDGDIVITVLEVNRRRVRLGIEAPLNKKIDRTETELSADSTSAIDGSNV